MELGTIKNYKVRFHLYTVPGQVFYNATRKLVLKGTDGVIFVADSQRAMVDANLESFANLRDNLNEMGIDLDNFPLVIQYNKRDLPDIFTIEEMNEALDPQGVIPFYEAVAMSGDGVLRTFTAVSKLVLQDMQRTPSATTSPSATSWPREESRPRKKPGSRLRLREPSMPGAPMAEAKPEMAALEKAVDKGMSVSLGAPLMEYGQIVLPFVLRTKDGDEQYQLRVSIATGAPMSKRFKVVVKNLMKE